MATKKELTAKYTLATKLQALIKKQVLGRVPVNQAINAIVSILPDPPKGDSTASLNAVKAGASKKFNLFVKEAQEATKKAVVETEKAIASATLKGLEETTLAVEKAVAEAKEKTIQNADAAFDVYIKKVLAVVKGTEFEKKIQEIK